MDVRAIIRQANGDVCILRNVDSGGDEHWSLPGVELLGSEVPHIALDRQIRNKFGVPFQLNRYLGAFRSSSGGSQDNVELLFTAELDGVPQDSDVRWCAPHMLPSTAHPLRRFLGQCSNDHARSRASLPINSDVVVLLVQPFFPFSDREALSIPLGLAGIQAVLQAHRIPTEVFDCCLPTEYPRLVRSLSRLRPAFVGVQFHSDMSFDWAIRTCRWLRSVLPEATLVGGGELATRRAFTLLSDHTLDYVVDGEGDLTFAELVLATRECRPASSVAGLKYLDDSGSLVSTHRRTYVRNLDDLPMIDIDAFDWSQYGQWTLFTSRGCPFRCTFCSSAAFWQHSIRFQSPARVVDELARLKERYGATDIYIADDIFTVNRKRTVAICSEIIRRGLKVKWSCLTRADCVDRELLIHMHSAGCAQISFGLESGNQSSLDRVNKAMELHKSATALLLSHEIGIRTRVSVIFGLPGDTESDLRSTLSFLLEVQPNEIQLYGLTPHDGTALYANLDNLGVRIINPEPAYWSRDVLNPVCETDLLPAARIVSLAKEFITSLQSVGYTYLSDDMPKKKIGARKTVATSFSPVQGIGAVQAEDSLSSGTK